MAGRHTALAVTGSGQMILLYEVQGGIVRFSDSYILRWSNSDRHWLLDSGGHVYFIQLPEDIMKDWLKSAVEEFSVREDASSHSKCLLSNLVIYYAEEDGRPAFRMVSARKGQLEEALSYLDQNRM